MDRNWVIKAAQEVMFHDNGSLDGRDVKVWHGEGVEGWDAEVGDTWQEIRDGWEDLQAWLP